MITLDVFDLPFALGLIVVAIALSSWQRLELEGQLMIAGGRSLLQLLVVGNILEIIFAIDHPLAVLAILAIMLTIATTVARNRIGKKIKGLLSVVWISIGTSTFLVVVYVMVLMIQPARWYDPQYLIPLAGMILGNAMNSASLAGERLVSSIKNHRLEIETHLSLGATAQQAIISYRREAIRTGLIPTLNNMIVLGLVSLPGMFTGQVLAGSSPAEAASYQILILFMIVLANLITMLLITQGVYRSFFNQDSWKS